MRTFLKIKKAFTMIELILVIIILGIVSSVGATIIADVYSAYIIQRSVHDASLRTELAINTIANRLTYRIDRSMIARKPSVAAYSFPPTADPSAYSADSLPIANIDTHTALEWIGYDNDSFSAYVTPAWSGFTDLDASTFATLVTIGSDLGNLIGTSHAIRFSNPTYTTKLGIPFPDYSASCMYFAHGCMFKVSGSGENLTFAANTTRTASAGELIYSEFYQLARSAYAIVPENNSTVAGVQVWDLNLYYDYQPWDGENTDDGSVSTLLKNVSVFRFKEESNAIRIKLCSIERIGDGNQTISMCKEKAVIR